ncbi:hypothetical protein [Methylibium rhizosphaerae]|uniref:hypothetical protein n=1 Tax=Methylibium rhizosphaerae TaxID=2570323 RepID=UPI0011272DB1|nr:hypothetical protein [Methylibium rhizosphaerae]
MAPAQQQPPQTRPAPPAQPTQPVLPVDTTGSHNPEPVDISAESVAGEEDPGAGLDAPDDPPGIEPSGAAAPKG